MSESKAHRRQVREALRNKELQTALERSVSAYRSARADVMSGFDLAAFQEEIRTIKERSIINLGALFARFKQEAERVGAVVHEASDGAAVANIIKSLAAERGVKLVVKSKSLLTEEIELNRRLIDAGLKVVETDLGEWIIQLAGEKPSHFTMPAMHKTREQIAKLFSKATGEETTPDVQKLVEVARKKLRQAFIDAEMGISGANIAIAETGTLVIVANEGNDRLVTTLPPIHVAILGYEKLVATMEEATTILKALPRSATGQKQTAYVSFITGPSRTTDIEKTLALGVHGPKELHIIFVDGGRKALANDNECREALYCIKCGACLNLCPVYQSVGGHAYGNAYMGGIGSVLTAFYRSLEAAEDTLALCAGCGYCKSICPSKIDTPRMVLELKRRLVRSRGLHLTSRLPLAVLRHSGALRQVLDVVRKFQPALMTKSNKLIELPLLSDLLGEKQIPGLAPKFLSELIPDCSKDTRSMTVSLYAGCMLEFVYPEIGQAIWDVLDRSGLNVVFPKDQACCGAPALYIGDFETARCLAAENVRVLGKHLPDYIVTGCPTCAVMLKLRFPMLLQGTEWEERAKSIAQRVVDFSQFAADVIKFESLRIVNPTIDNLSSNRVTYHDPCHQVRGLGTSRFPREIIRCAGVELVEMDGCDECCGFAGLYALKQPGISASILERKIARICATGAGTVVTDCPGCIFQIKGGLAKRDISIDVCHTAQFIAGGCR
jgi:L-lactate dehydrogenase complex protein LldF